MNMETARMLTALPDHLKARGWRFIKTASRMSYGATPACIAVYVRRFEPGIDDERWIDQSLYGFVRVTTEEAKGPTWEAAKADGIAQMARIDAGRTDL